MMSLEQMFTGELGVADAPPPTAAAAHVPLHPAAKIQKELVEF
jgi:hypothetical protein